MNLVETDYYLYGIILKFIHKYIGKISVRIENNYRSYYNENIGYEIDEEYRGNHYSYSALTLQSIMIRILLYDL